jgi:hypothetical protein
VVRYSSLKKNRIRKSVGTIQKKEKKNQLGQIAKVEEEVCSSN